MGVVGGEDGDAWITGTDMLCSGEDAVVDRCRRRGRGALRRSSRIHVLCVRMDLKMGKGKIAAQCCHACLGVWKKLWRRRDPVLKVWEECGQAKVTLQVKDEEAMLDLYQRAKKIGVPTYIVVDAGRTQIAPNSEP